MTDGIQPRLLTVTQAAAYLSVPAAEVKRSPVGRVTFGTRVRYDRVALDEWLDEQRGIAPKSAFRAEQDDPEAALARISERLANDSRRS